MANPSITITLFDDEKFYNDLFDLWEARMDTFAKEVKDELVGIIIRKKGSYPDEWAWDAVDSLVINYYVDRKKTVFHFDWGFEMQDEAGWFRTLAMNFGIGKYVDRTNPLLPEYMQSDYYNTKRTGFKILSRPNEEYFNLTEGDWVYSQAVTVRPVKGRDSKPIHFERTIQNYIRKRFPEINDDLLDSMDIGRYQYQQEIYSD